MYRLRQKLHTYKAAVKNWTQTYDNPNNELWVVAKSLNDKMRNLGINNDTTTQDRCAESRKQLIELQTRKVLDMTQRAHIDWLT